MKFRLSAIVFLMLIPGLLFAAEFSENVEYKRIQPQKTASGDKIVVLEFFWYGCPHCYTFDAYIKRWKKNKPDNVEFTLVPAPLNPQWAVHTRAYYALELMGEIEKVHGPMFEAIHKKKQRLTDMASIADFVATLGVDKQQFLDTAKSFAVAGKIRKAEQLVHAYRLDGVPALAVNGKYMTGPYMAGNPQRAIDVLNYLIDKETKDQGQ